MPRYKATYIPAPHGAHWALLEDGLIVHAGFENEDEVREWAGQTGADAMDTIQEELSDLSDRQEQAEDMIRFSNGEDW